MTTSLLVIFREPWNWYYYTIAFKGNPAINTATVYIPGASGVILPPETGSPSLRAVTGRWSGPHSVPECAAAALRSGKPGPPPAAFRSGARGAALQKYLARKKKQHYHIHMCDTLFFRNAKNPDDALFAKNSDRHPAERQIFHFAPGSRELTDTLLHDPPEHYLKGPWRQLADIFPSFTHPYGAFISRPVWMWGAEMGVNEHGLAIGNEALFSLKETPRHEGLLGMDMLRIALHNCRHAEAALDLLIRLIEEKGQGGNGSDHGSLYYHNGFLISDPAKSFILESAGRRWALREIRSSGSISNDYTLGTRGIEADRCSPGEDPAQFGARCRSPIHGIITRGSTRQKRTSALAAEVSAQKASLTPGGGDPLFRNGARILRDHDGPGMSSVCMHSPLWPKSETTASMMVRYHKERFVIWYTGTPLPCRSHFKPVCFQEGTEAELEEEFSDSPAVVARFENARRSIREMAGADPARDAEEALTSETVTRELCCGTGTSLAAACRQARETAGDLVPTAGPD